MAVAIRHRAAVDPADAAVRPPPGHRRAPSDDPLAVASQPRVRAVDGAASRLRSRHAARDDRPRPRRALGPRLRPPPRAHADRPVARPGPLGLLGAHARRAGDPRGACPVPRGRRQRAGRPHDARRRARPRVAQADLRAQRAARGDGRRLVPRRLLPARGDDRPAVGRLAGRGAGRPTRPSGWGRPGSGPGSSARSGPTSRGSRHPRSASTAPRPGPPGGPASPSRPTPSCPTSAPPSSRCSRRRASIPGASSSGMPTAIRCSTTTCR